jgi:hypothetical protein
MSNVLYMVWPLINVQISQRNTNQFNSKICCNIDETENRDTLKFPLWISSNDCVKMEQDLHLPAPVGGSLGGESWEKSTELWKTLGLVWNDKE